MRTQLSLPTLSVAKLFAAGSVVAASVPLAFADPADAQIYNCGTLRPGGQNPKIGHGFGGSGPDWELEGIYAKMTVRHAPVCDTDTNPGTNFTMAWVMADDPTSSGEYFQTGYMRWYGSLIHPFTETSTCVGCHVRVVDLNSYYTANTDHTAKVVYTETGCISGLSGCYYAYQDGIYRGRSNFNPRVTFSRPARMLIGAETTYNESDVAGTNAARAGFTELQGQRYSDHGWTQYMSVPGTFQHDPLNRYHQTAISSCGGYKCFSTWTG